MCFREPLRTRVEALRASGKLEVRGSPIASIIVLPDFYERRGFRRAWGEPRNVEQLTPPSRMPQLTGSIRRDYNEALLDRLRREVGTSTQPNAALVADYDLLLTDALIRTSDIT